MNCRMAIIGVLLTAAVSSRAAQLIDEGVTYDPATHYYTYHYAVDNTAGTARVTEVSVLVTPQNTQLDLPPMFHTSPSGWSYRTAFGGPSPPSGTFEQWYSASGVAAGAHLSGFSFSTPYPPVATSTPNYFLFNEPSAAVDVGIVQAPQLPASAELKDVPLLDRRNLMLLAIVLASVAALAIRA